jgi:hypothetical protein
VTALDSRTPAGTATGPTLRSTTRSVRAPLLVLLALVLAGIVAAALSATDRSGGLDPDAFDPSGGRALAELLRDRDVRVDEAGTIEQVREADSPGTTVLVVSPEGLADSELSALADLQASLVVLAPDDTALEALGLDVTSGGPVEVDVRQPACDLPVAQRAGAVDAGGLTYEVGAGVRAVGCYATSGEASLLALPDERVVLLGTGLALTNDALDTQGNAALALGLLGEGDRAVFLLPLPGRAVPDDDGPTLGDLLPGWIVPALVQAGIAVGVVALWRARRLGRVVEEPLPVVVRAAEAVEGRGRLYRAAGARAQAAEQLRSGTRDRVVRRLGLGLDPSPPAVVDGTARRTGRDPAEVEALLYGAAPADDAALVRLADDLRSLSTALTDVPQGPSRSEVAGS